VTADFLILPGPVYVLPTQGEEELNESKTYRKNILAKKNRNEKEIKKE